MPLSVIFDHAQRRLKRDRISALAAGMELNGEIFQDVWIDPVKHLLMLRPGPMYPEWYTLNTGIYRKIGPDEVTPTNPGNWYATPDYRGGDLAAGPWISSKGAGPGLLVTNEVLFKNRAMYVSALGYGGGDNYELFNGGWNPSPTPNYLSSVGFRVWTGGDFEIWKNGDLKAVYQFSGGLTGAQQTNVPLDLLLIPCSRRELLVVSRNGSGFTHVFDDIDEDDPDPIITPQSKFFVNFPTAAAQVQLAKIFFPSFGFGTSIPYQLGLAPEIGAILEQFNNPDFAGGNGQPWRMYGDPPYAGLTPGSSKAYLVNLDGSTFVANGGERLCRVKAELYGDGNYTPFVRGAMIAYDSVSVETNATEEQNIDDSLAAFTLEVPDQANGVTMSIELLSPETLSQSIGGLLRVGNRPIKSVIDGVDLVDGQSEGPTWGLATFDFVQRLKLQIRDRFKSLETYTFRERVVLDSFGFTDAIKFVLKRIGLTAANWEIEEIDFSLDDVPGVTAEEFNYEIEIGDTADKVLQDLIETYASTYHWGFEPTKDGIKFVMKSPATLEQQDVAVELWPDRLLAIAQGKSEEEAAKLLYWTAEMDEIQCTANDIWITGYNPREQRSLQSHYPDGPSQDPTLEPSARPDNWLGEPLLFGQIDPKITSQASADRVAQLAFDRLTPLRRMVEFTCEMLFDSDSDGVPVWRGRDIRLHPPEGRPEPSGRYRIVSFRVQCEKEPDGEDTWQYRPATYVARWISA